MRKITLRLFLLIVLFSMLWSCQTESLQDQNETFTNNSNFHFTSKRISLTESKHKAKISTELQHVNGIFKNLQTYISGKTAEYNNGVSINTDDVIYIERGPNFHSYTFHITRENAPADAPLENLVLSLLPDGTYKVLLITYLFTPQEKQILMNDGSLNTKNKFSIEELSPGTYNEGGPAGKSNMSCEWIEESYYTSCSEGQHFNGELPKGQGGPCKADQPSALVTVVVHRCKALPASTALGDDGTGGGGGPTNPGGLGGGNNDGTPTIPNLPPPKSSPCAKITRIGRNSTTKQLFENLKTKFNSNQEFGEFLTESGGQINNISVVGQAGLGGINIDITAPIDGFIHSHHVGLLSVFTAADLASLSLIHKNWFIKNPNTFIFGLVSASNTQYILIIDNPAKFLTFTDQFLTPDGKIDEGKTDNFSTMNYLLDYNIHINNTPQVNELGFVKMLSEKDSGLKVLRGSNNSNDWEELSIKDGQILAKPCN